MSDPWAIPVRALRTGAVRTERRQAPLGRLVVADTVVDAVAAVDADVTLTAIDGGIEVGGTISAPFEGLCRRCTRPVTGRVTAEVRELYRPRSERAPDGDLDEDTYELGVDHLDLAPLARDAVLLEMPIALLCDEACAGLCDKCGADLNEGVCACPVAPVDDRWSVLDVLREPPATPPSAPRP